MRIGRHANFVRTRFVGLAKLLSRQVYLEEADSQEDEAVGADAASEHLVQVSL